MLQRQSIRPQDFLTSTQAGSIITIRPILGITAEVVTLSGAYYQPFSCKVVEYLVVAVGPAFRVAKLYPACEAYMAGEDPEAWTVVRANMNDDQSPLGAAAALQIGFSTGMVLAFILHAFLVELYVGLSNPPWRCRTMYLLPFDS